MMIHKPHRWYSEDVERCLGAAVKARQISLHKLMFKDTMNYCLTSDMLFSELESTRDTCPHISRGVCAKTRKVAPVMFVVPGEREPCKLDSRS